MARGLPVARSTKTQSVSPRTTTLPSDLRINSYFRSDLTFRMSMSGHSCWVCSDANAFHQSRKRGFKWVQMQIRNRWWFLRKNYDRRTLLLAMPSILLFQVMVGLFLLIKGQGRAFMMGTKEGWGNGRQLAEKRANVQKHRVVSDQTLLCGDRLLLTGGLSDTTFGKIVSTFISIFFWLYWCLIKPLLRSDYRSAGAAP